MTKKKKKRKSFSIGKKEFIFNLVSLLVVISIGLYFGGRSFYYYGAQNFKLEQEAKTLNGVVVNYNKVTSGDGLHQDTDGYYFKGNISNNYVKFANRLFRIVRINKDSTIKLVADSNAATFMWGENSNYENSNLDLWLGEGTYYKSIPNVSDFLVKTNYTEDILNNSSVKDSKKSYSDYVTTLGIKDYTMANGSKSYLNNGKSFWLIGKDSNNENIYVDASGSVQSSDMHSSFGIRPVITLKKNLEIYGGDGTISNPYIIKQNEKINYVDSYIKLGNDVWKVSSDDGKVLKLYLNGYIINNGFLYTTNYSDNNSFYDINNQNSLAYYLNTTYFNSLSYNFKILDTKFDIGEISDDSGYGYNNIYNGSVVAKVGLLNIFDYYSGISDDFFYINTTSTIGSMVYIHSNSGILKEASVDEVKPVVPVISINRPKVIGGKGLIDDPYLVE